jgi:hypothetical protein
MPNIVEFESLPTFVSIRKSSLKEYGGDLDTLYDVPRWDGQGTSRSRAAHACRKDWQTCSVHRANKHARRQMRFIMGKE